MAFYRISTTDVKIVFEITYIELGFQNFCFSLAVCVCFYHTLAFSVPSGVPNRRGGVFGLLLTLCLIQTLAIQ